MRVCNVCCVLYNVHTTQTHILRIDIVECRIVDRPVKWFSPIFYTYKTKRKTVHKHANFV